MMDLKDYTPAPIDTSDVELPEPLIALGEELARNVHEVWARARYQDGWKYGPQRDDELKTHPCLVPYEELDEEAKEYDRNTSLQTLKLIVKLGFTIGY